MWTLDDLECFDRVVREGSFAAVARSMGVTRSAVSKTVRRLEEALGVQLLTRTTRQLHLTEVGHVFHAWVQPILVAAEGARQAVERYKGAPSGCVRVGAPVALGLSHVTGLAQRFVALHADVEVDLSLTDRVVDLLADELDVSLRLVFDGAMPDSELIARRLARGRMRLCASPGFLERHRAPAKLSEVAGLPCVVFSHRLGRDRRGHWVMHGPGGDKETVEVVGRLRSDSGAAVREAVRAGVGVGLMPGFLVEEDLGAGRLLELLPGYEGLAYGVYALYVPSLYPMPVLRAFLDFVVEELAGASL